MKSADELRQERIDYEIIVDCYDDDEVMMGWYYYLEEKGYQLKAGQLMG